MSSPLIIVGVLAVAFGTPLAMAQDAMVKEALTEEALAEDVMAKKEPMSEGTTAKEAPAKETVRGAVAKEAVAQEALAFKGFQIGAPRTDFLETYPGGTCNDDSCRWPSDRLCPPKYQRCLSHDNWKYGPTRPLRSVVYFSNERLASVLFHFPSVDFDRLVAALKIRYGDPVKEESIVLQNSIGIVFISRTMAWDRGEAVLRVSERSGRIDEGSVLFTGKRYLQEQEIKQKEADKANARNL